MDKHCATVLPPDKHLKFGIIAARMGLSKSALLRRMVDEFIIKSEKPKGGILRKGGRV